MHRQKKALILILVFTLSIFSMSMVFLVGMSAGSKFNPLDVEPMKLGPGFRDEYRPINPVMEGEGETEAEPGGPEIVDTKTWLCLDDYNGYYFFDDFDLWAVGNGTTAEIWLQQDMTWPDPDPQGRPDPVITEDQVAYLLDEFETNIVPTDSEYFGEPDFHDGEFSLLEAWGYFPEGYYFSEEGKNVVLVSNVRDTNYYEEFPYYIAGFYSPSFEAYFDRNIISIDCYNWEDRVGPDGARPYLYESVIAHEYQHLIHDDWNPDDDAFMNEGCSMFAELVCGYPVPYGDVNSYMATPDNSLTVWNDQGDINILADYGGALLWATYLNDQYSTDEFQFLSLFVKSGIPGIGGINAALAALGHTDTFMDAYHNWRIANLIHTDAIGGGKYNYESIDLDIADPIRVYDVGDDCIPWTRGTDFGNTITILGYDTYLSMVGPYGTDYIGFSGLQGLNKFKFLGDEEAIYGWQLTPDGWYSSGGNLMNTLLYGDAYVDPSDPTLTIETYWDIEDYWDFGFVQVSTDGGSSWTSLGNEYTTMDHDMSAHPDIIDNLPGLTGWSVDIITMDFDLSAYAGQTVQIGFRYMTDWFTIYEGWYIMDAEVSGADLDLEIVYPPADFMVTVVEVTTHTFMGLTFVTYRVTDVQLFDLASTMLWCGNDNKQIFLLVSPTMENGYTDYQFKVCGYIPSCWW
jgi:hypothetical protein